MYSTFPLGYYFKWEHLDEFERDYDLLINDGNFFDVQIAVSNEAENILFDLYVKEKYTETIVNSNNDSFDFNFEVDLFDGITDVMVADYIGYSAK
jgi:hypothetical protein